MESLRDVCGELLLVVPLISAEQGRCADNYIFNFPLFTVAKYVCFPRFSFMSAISAYGFRHAPNRQHTNYSHSHTPICEEKASMKLLYPFSEIWSPSQERMIFSPCSALYRTFVSLVWARVAAILSWNRPWPISTLDNHSPRASCSGLLLGTMAAVSNRFSGAISDRLRYWSNFFFKCGRAKPVVHGKYA